MKIKHIIFGLILLITACSKKKTEIPADILSMQDMKGVLTDVQLGQAAAGNSAMVDSALYNSKEYFEFVLKNHNVSRDVFMKSLKFYSENPALLQEVYDSVIVDLSKIQSQSEAR